MGKPVIDQDKCTGCGSCNAICPEVFSQPDKKGVVSIKGTSEEILKKKKKEIEEAIIGCPVQAIRIE